MSIGIMVEGWHQDAEIEENAPDVSMTGSSMHQVLAASGYGHCDCGGDSIAAEQVGEFARKLQDLVTRLTGDAGKELLRTRAVNVWSVAAFAHSRNRGMYWA